jgi:hypothetical protein
LTGAVAALALAAASLLVACDDDQQQEDVAKNELFGVNAQFGEFPSYCRRRTVAVPRVPFRVCRRSRVAR